MKAEIKEDSEMFVEGKTSITKMKRYVGGVAP